MSELTVILERALDAPEAYSVNFSADGKHLAVASALGFARIYDTATWREEAKLTGFLNAVSDVSFSPDGHRRRHEVRQVLDCASPLALCQTLRELGITTLIPQPARTAQFIPATIFGRGEILRAPDSIESVSRNNVAVRSGGLLSSGDVLANEHARPSAPE